MQLPDQRTVQRTRHHAGDVLQVARPAAERRSEAFRPRRRRPRGGTSPTGEPQAQGNDRRADHGT